MDAADGVVFDAYYMPRKPQIDSSSEMMARSIIALATENIKSEILEAAVRSDTYMPVLYEAKLDCHLDGAAHQTFFSMCLRDHLDLKIFMCPITKPRQVC